METSLILKEIKEAVLVIEPKAEIILFGSEARGTSGKHSDIDLLILLDGKRSFQEKMKISPFVLSHSDLQEQSGKTPFYYEVQEEGIRI